MLHQLNLAREFEIRLDVAKYFLSNKKYELRQTADGKRKFNLVERQMQNMVFLLKLQCRCVTVGNVNGHALMY